MEVILSVSCGILAGIFIGGLSMFLLNRARKNENDTGIRLLEHDLETQKTSQKENEERLRGEFKERIDLMEKHHQQQIVSLEQAKTESEARFQSDLTNQEARSREALQNAQTVYEKNIADQEQRSKENLELAQRKYEKDLTALEQRAAEAQKTAQSKYEKDLENLEARHREELLNVRQTYEKNLATLEQRHREALESAERIQKERTESMRTEFRSMSAELLKQQGETERKTHLEQLDSVLNPLRTQLTEYRDNLEKTKNDYNKLNGDLTEQCRRMIDETKKIGMEADQLTNALTADVKFQGDWGEMILEGLLNNAGLIANEHYTVQDVLRTPNGDIAHSEEGKIMRTDVIVHFPDGKDIVIDSKVSLTAYMRYVNARSPEEREAALREHRDSVKKHIAELGRKRYSDYPQNGHDMIDFTVMFVPVEPALSVAFSGNSDLWEFASQSKVCVVSPMNLIAMLRIAKALWTRSDQEKNYLEIIKTAEQLLSRISTLCGCVSDIRKKLSDVQNSCEQAAGLLGMQKGKHSIGNSAQKLVDLGVKIKAADMKKLQKALSEDAETPELPENVPGLLPESASELLPENTESTDCEPDHD